MPLHEAELQLRALPARRRTAKRAARRVGRWVAAGTLLASVAGAGAVAAVAHSRPGDSVDSIREPALTTTATTAPPAFVFADGLIETAEGKWSIGLPDDVVALGDWDCDGVNTPALLRPSTGTVYAFADWAQSGSDEVAELLGTLPAADELLADDVDGDGCDDVLARTSNGDEMVFHPADQL